MHRHITAFFHKIEKKKYYFRNIQDLEKSQKLDFALLQKGSLLGFSFEHCFQLKETRSTNISYCCGSHVPVCPLGDTHIRKLIYEEIQEQLGGENERLEQERFLNHRKAYSYPSVQHYKIAFVYPHQDFF